MTESSDWGSFFSSREPVVELVGADNKSGRDFGFDLAVAAARSCYNKELVRVEDVGKFENNEGLAEGILGAGHHTPFMHQALVFGMDGVSRQLIWSLLHSHPFYNSEQVSQRYKKMALENVVIPSLKGKASAVYRECVKFEFDLYLRLRDELLVRKAFEEMEKRNLPASVRKNIKVAVKKKTQEVARYVLPVATMAHLYHTINPITLARYAAYYGSCDVPTEAGLVVERMIGEVERHFPKLGIMMREFAEKSKAGNLEDEIRGWKKDETEIEEWKKEFDALLGERKSRLVDYKLSSMAEVANSIRDIVGKPKSMLSNEEALKLVLDPSYNRRRGNILTPDHVVKFERALYMAGFTFMIKISHTADSQEQRQRMTFGARPVFARQVSSSPDFIVPALVEASGEEVVKIYEEGMGRIWGYRNELIGLGVSEETANYLLPNATTLRFRENVDLLNFMQKDTKRECLNAQEEIGRITLEQRRDVETRFPELAGRFGPPCYARKQKGEKPVCPEGDRFCGVPVWRGLGEEGEEKFSIEKLMNERII